MTRWILCSLMLSATLAYTNMALAQEAVDDTAAADTTATDDATAEDPAPVETAPVETQPVEPQPAPAGPPPKSSGRGLIIGGWIWFGVMYAPSLIYGIASSIKYDLGGQAIHIIPIFGPIALGAMAIAAGGIYEDAGGATPAGTIAKVIGVFHIIWGLLEAGALTMAIVGHVKYAEYKASLGAELDNPLYHDQKIGFSVSPVGTADSVGLGLVGTF